MYSKTSSKKIIFKIRKVKRWTEEEDLLIKAVSSKASSRRNWKSILTQMNRKTMTDCISRHNSTFFRKGRWTEDEDQSLINLFEVVGPNWSFISKKLNFRSWRQVRDRYNNILDPKISQEPFTLEEDLIIFDLYSINGTKWATLARHFTDRNAEKINTRFYSFIKPKVNIFASLRQEQKLHNFNLI